MLTHRSAQPGAQRGRLLISCPDRPGIVAAVSEFLYRAGANIVHSDQHTTDPAGGLFFMRLVFDLPGLDERGAELEAAFGDVARRLAMEWRLEYASRRKRLAIFVSREEHCLLELLWQRRAGDLPADVALVVSNHPDARPTAEGFGIPFHCLPVTADNREEVERAQLALLDGAADLIVLARYMQILSPEVCKRVEGRMINIHHSFLPSFKGAKPYHQAYAKGVKLVGATAHYVTPDLDEGPIIEQGLMRVDHSYSPERLVEAGRDVEAQVLARAVTWHAEHRVLLNGNRTVVLGGQ
jgi:formyltetrahydrofolate deformylase